MKNAISTLVLLAGMVFGGPAFAERWASPVNGTVSAVMMQNGAVMMKVEMPAEEFKAMGRAMKMGQNNCRLMEIYPGATDTVILTCGG